MRNKLKELKSIYEDLTNKLNNKKSNGNLSILANLNETFDETFDNFFDKKELRQKYFAWDDKEGCIDTNKSNADLENMLDDIDLKNLIEFYQTYLGNLEDELMENLENLEKEDFQELLRDF